MIKKSINQNTTSQKKTFAQSKPLKKPSGCGCGKKRKKS
ncbi:hypothetical protein J2S17_000578 [Cytobacillus purgationiresistens]|uniref:Uncharacterized protein n=1 Tax=Cytobacillus purgationiresistens TaxID=863449 RepID=A0ABU0ABT2_9BACI|nr:hypothetical protein [Cytobacillus purgationiresistens]